MGPAPDATPLSAAADFLRVLDRPSRILVGISGGSDSTGLLIALLQANQALHFNHSLFAATVDHGLRPEAAQEARQVGELCTRLDVSHSIHRWDEAKPSSGLMAAAREARYGLLANAARDIGADMLVTGHTLDDQRETLFMRKARMTEDQAAYASGISDAVLFDRRIWVLRPLLGCRREEIRSFLRQQGIGWIDDPSNVDQHYERVRVRSVLDGEGVIACNDGVSARSGLSFAAAAWLSQFVGVHAGLVARIERDGLDAGSRVFAYGLAYLAAVIGGQPYGPGHSQMQRVLSFIGDGKPGRRTAGGVVFDLRRDGLYLTRESRNLPSLCIEPGRTAVWDGRFLISNGRQEAVDVSAGGPGHAVSFGLDLPRGVVLRALSSAPSLRNASGQWIGKPGDVTVAPWLAPFDRYLTRTDLRFADELARTFDRTAYLSPPF
jgi:tRNA(Ile)-lysidine synthase